MSNERGFGLGRWKRKSELGITKSSDWQDVLYVPCCRRSRYLRPHCSTAAAGSRKCPGAITTVALPRPTGHASWAQVWGTWTRKTRFSARHRNPRSLPSTLSSRCRRRCRCCCHLGALLVGDRCRRSDDRSPPISRRPTCHRCRRCPRFSWTGTAGRVAATRSPRRDSDVAAS